MQSSWHRDIVDQARSAFLEQMKKEGFERRALECFEGDSRPIGSAHCLNWIEQ